MKLRQKALLIIGLTLIGLNVGLYFVASSILGRSFQRVEDEKMQELVNSTAHSLQQVFHQFNDRFADWAAWNETLDFVQGQKTDYIESNLSPAAVGLLQVNLIAIVNPAGKIIFSTAFDSKTQQGMPLPGSLQARLTLDNKLLQHPNETSDFGGLLVLPEGIVLIASRPILNNQGEGPVGGTIIFGRYLDQTKIDELSKIVGQSFSLVPVQSESFDAQQRALYNQLKAQGAPITEPLMSSDRVAGYTLLNDIYGQPSLLLQVTAPRTVKAQYYLAMRYLVVAILVLDVAFAIATIVLLERLVIARMMYLSTEVSQLRNSNGLSQRVTIDRGEDELTHLGHSINQLLQTLEDYERDRQSTAQVLERAKFAAEAANRAKSQFLANMSHELRTPLTAILGYSEMMALELHDLGRPDLCKDIERIEKSGYHLLDIIKDMLDFSDLEAEKISLCIEPFNLTEIVQDAIRKAEPWAAQNGNRLIVNCPSQLGIMESDPKRVRQCLLNLLNNACKFTHHGNITLSIDAPYPPLSLVHPAIDLSAASTDLITFHVSDTGIGIAPDQLSRIFDPFTQVDESNTRRYGGTGLGLAITKRLCQAMGGQMSVKSWPQKGTTFTLQLPMIAPSIPTEEENDEQTSPTIGKEQLRKG